MDYLPKFAPAVSLPFAYIRRNVLTVFEASKHISTLSSPLKFLMASTSLHERVNFNPYRARLTETRARLLNEDDGSNEGPKTRV